MSSKVAIFPFVVTVACFSSNANSQAIDGHFNQLRFGESRTIVMTLMGEPAGLVDGLLFGVPHAEIRWVVGGRTYVVDLIMDRVVSKRVCQAMPSC